jgi:hypothetical protein
MSHMLTGRGKLLSWRRTPARKRVSCPVEKNPAGLMRARPKIIGIVIDKALTRPFGRSTT